MDKLKEVREQLPADQLYLITDSHKKGFKVLSDPKDKRVHIYTLSTNKHIKIAKGTDMGKKDMITLTKKEATTLRDTLVDLYGMPK